MNSYPPELLAQLAPVMFVAGLGHTGPPASAVSPEAPPTPSKTTQDPFTLLTSRLRDALLAQRKVAIWQPDKSKSFQTILVDKDVRFPPRKLHSQDDSQSHSPLSPLTPSSPLHPDGLIAPIWIRKHTTLVPSVFVLFLNLFELPPHNPRSPLDAPDPDRERERESEERRKDAELSAEIAQRKKSTNERGIKLTVVLMASRRMLDDPSLDSRLTYIRRQSGLDSRAALFVLSPVSSAELGDFVRSLQQALYEPAIEYYTSHSKRVRRKRNRHSQAVSTYPSMLSPLGTGAVPRPLRPEGWTVRYEYKMACFAEFRGEDEVALKHYQDAYGMLVIMFGSTAILPPRTKRWAEAKVLADCINVKVCKLYLYNNEHSLALSHHNMHMRRFSDFSRGWGIGEETYEFWAWLARQHRVLAELLEQGTYSTLVIPTHLPITPASAQALARSSGSVLEADSLRALGLNPSHALQHPGFYYYMAARCTETRRERFIAAAESEATALHNAPGFLNEKKVDHLTIVLELYTKSYELFKKYNPTSAQGQSQGRLTLWIAYRIAQTYYDSGKFDMAVRFFERIAKTYRREKWGTMLRPLLSTWYSCAKALGDVELTVRLLIELLGHGDVEESGALQEDLLAVLKSTVPSTLDEPFLVDLSESEPIFSTSVIFWSPEVKVNEEAAFQLSIAAPTDTVISSLPITSLSITFSDDAPPIIVKHAASETSASSVQYVSLGRVSERQHEEGSELPTFQANLRWQPGGRIILAGTMSSDAPRLLEVSKLLFTLSEGSWKIDIPCDPCRTRKDSVPHVGWLSSREPVRFLPMTRDNLSTVTVRHRPHNLRVSVTHNAPAYLDEEYPILIDITNEDDRELDIAVDVLLQPSDIDHAVNQIVFDDQTSSGLIKGIPFGVVAPGVNVLKTLHLINTGAAGDRVLDISVQSRSTATPAPVESPTSPEYPASAALVDTNEILQTMVVPTAAPFKVTRHVSYRRALGEGPGLADLRTYEGDFWDDRDGGEAIVTTTLECTGPWGVDIESLKLDRKDGAQAKVSQSSSDSDGDDAFPIEYLTGDEFSDVCQITLAPEEEQDNDNAPIAGPGEYAIVWKRILSNGDRGPRATSRFLLPSLQPPTDGLIALLHVPPTAKLHTPIPMRLTVRNRHPTRSANVVVQLQPDPSDGFIVAGLRSGRVPTMLPRTEERLTWQIIPVECGYVPVPRIKVMDKRKAIASAHGAAGPNSDAESEGQVIKVIDVRWDQRGSDETEGADHDSLDSAADGDVPSSGSGLHTILVLP
ncbi:hypothetical protein PLICRDRAFT_662357 [Plicaturopsis crispa FD-325 SS-3]|nr:hypothetical protein PLICRDRAFT_662357 [Plicaturopsis crispa FD-325 SS-3]